MTKRISLDLDDQIYKSLVSRSKTQLLSLRELIEDILRRSTVTYKNRGGRGRRMKIDDKLVGIFSREKRGRKKKVVKKKKK